MSANLLLERPHRRLNVLTGEWVFVSPQRLERPWRGARESPEPENRAAYDPECYLCPGNVRALGVHNPDYSSTYVFENDFPAFLEAAGSPTNELRPSQDRPDFERSVPSSLLIARAQSGVCRVLCYSPRHDQTLSQLPLRGVRSVVRLWMDQAEELEARWRWVQIFENKGELMGCSNPHPHGQIWAGDFIPTEVARELASQDRWFAENKSPLLVDYAALEHAQGERVVIENEHWLAVVPWWAAWPFETLLVPRRWIPSLTGLTEPEQAALASLMRRLLQAYDRLFETPFPYSLGWHGAGADTGHAMGRHLHAHVYSSLLRSAHVRKFMVGYEMLAEVQRDLTPERAAERLRAAVGG